jgi:acetyl esterase/lipase
MTAPYRGMERAALDAAYNNSAAVADSAQIVAGWQRRSAALAQRKLELRYGDGERNRIDLFEQRAGAPLLAFIHGGYWQARSRELFYFLAPGPMAHGFSVAFVGYSLAPEKRLDGIVAEVRAALDCLGRRVILCGWSAGGHLTAMAMEHPSVQAGLAISGIYDLEPIRHSYLNEKLRLDEAMSRRNSPMMTSGGPAKPLSLVVGNAELALLRKQTADFAGHRARHGLPVTYEEIPGTDHFTIMNELIAPGGRIATLIRHAFEWTAA